MLACGLQAFWMPYEQVCSLLSLLPSRSQNLSGDPNAISNIAPPMEEEYDVPPLDFYAHEYFAVCLIQRSVTVWLHTKRELEKQYMEEYKNKIKKPSGRPKKVRDARVYTIG